MCCVSEDRERLTELVFEKFESPALFLSKGGVLSAFSCGKASALVIDVGEQVRFLRSCFVSICSRVGAFCSLD